MEEVYSQLNTIMSGDFMNFLSNYKTGYINTYKTTDGWKEAICNDIKAIVEQLNKISGNLDTMNRQIQAFDYAEEIVLHKHGLIKQSQ